MTNAQGFALMVIVTVWAWAICRKLDKILDELKGAGAPELGGVAHV